VDATLAATIAEANVLRYAGYCYDEHSGMYYLSQRYYDPATCQFITKDPAKADGEESAYQYCGGEPVGKVDPSGKIAVRTQSSTYSVIEALWNAWWTTRSWSTYYYDRFIEGFVGAKVPSKRMDLHRRYGWEYKYLLQRDVYRDSGSGRLVKAITYILSSSRRQLSQTREVWYKAHLTTVRSTPLVASYSYYKTVYHGVKRGNWQAHGSRSPQDRGSGRERSGTSQAGQRQEIM